VQRSPRKKHSLKLLKLIYEKIPPPDAKPGEGIYLIAKYGLSKLWIQEPLKYLRSDLIPVILELLIQPAPV
jgi:hypothetical protein